MPKGKKHEWAGTVTRWLKRASLRPVDVFARQVPVATIRGERVTNPRYHCAEDLPPLRIDPAFDSLRYSDSTGRSALDAGAGIRDVGLAYAHYRRWQRAHPEANT